MTREKTPNVLMMTERQFAPLIVASRDLGAQKTIPNVVLADQGNLEKVTKTATDLVVSALVKSLGTRTPKITVSHQFDDSDAKIFVSLVGEEEMELALAASGLPDLRTHILELLQGGCDALRLSSQILHRGYTPNFRRTDSLSRFSAQASDQDGLILTGGPEVERVMRKINDIATDYPQVLEFDGTALNIAPKLQMNRVGCRADHSEGGWMGVIQMIDADGVLSIVVLRHDLSKTGKLTRKRSTMKFRLNQENFDELFDIAGTNFTKRLKVLFKVTQLLPSGGAIYGEIDSIRAAGDLFGA